MLDLRAIVLVGGFAVGNSLSAAPILCGPLDPNPNLGINQTCNVTRDVSIFIGTLTPVGVPVAPINLVWGSDGIAASLRDALNSDPASDPRLTFALLDALVVPGGSIAWAMANSDNLPSALVLQGAALDVTYGTGTLALGPATLLRGPTIYLLQNGITVFDGPCGVGGLCILNTNYRGNVAVYEQNATWTQAATATVPEPSSAGLLLGGLALLIAKFRAAESAKSPRASTNSRLRY